MASKFIVLIPHYWGRGDTAQEAANAALSQCGKRARKTMPKPRIVFEYDPEKTTKAYVDDFGSLCWLGERPVEVEKVLK